MDEAPLHVNPIVLYDGSCGLCHRAVKFLLRHERDTELMFAPLQGPTAAALRVQFPEIPTHLDTVVLVEAGRAWLRSKAFLHVSHHLRGPWSWAYALRWLPAVIGDLAYRMIAAIRYRVWGRADECALPSPEQRSRFLP